MPLQAWQVQSEPIPPQTRQSQLGLMQWRSRRWRSQPAPAHTQQAQAEDAAGAAADTTCGSEPLRRARLRAGTAQGARSGAPNSSRAGMRSFASCAAATSTACGSEPLCRPLWRKRWSGAWPPLEQAAPTGSRVKHVQRHVACGESDWGPWLASARVTGCPWLANKQALTRSQNGFALLQRHYVWRHDRLGSLARKRENDWVPQNMSTCKCGHAAGKASRSLPGGSSRIAHRPRLVTARVRGTSQLTDQVSSRLPRPSGSRTPRWSHPAAARETRVRVRPAFTTCAFSAARPAAYPQVRPPVRKS